MPEIARIWTPGGVVFQQGNSENLREVVRPVPYGPDYPRPPREFAGSEQGGFHGGFASTYRLAARSAMWFHFPIATPTMLGSAGAVYLDHFGLLWEATDGATISWVTFHHRGAERYELTPRLHRLSGSHKWGDDPANRFFVRPRLKVEFAVQLGVMVEAHETDGQIAFYGVGASFWDEPLD
jgi:hypothetical protein